MSETMSDRSWCLLKWFGIGAVAATIIVVPLLSGRTEPVTKERLAEAARLWHAAKIANYAMDLETSGAQTGKYHIEVRDGQLARITRNGQAADPASGEFWTVDGLLRMIEQELDAAEHPGKGMFPEQTQVWLRLRYDARSGYPVRYSDRLEKELTRHAARYRSR